MRTKRTNGITVRYKVTDKTNIEHLTTKQFLAKIEVKNDLSMYLAEKVEIYLNDLGYVFVYRNTCITNMMNLKETLFDYNQEGADKGIVLHAFDISERDPFTDLVISCSDTDVLLILSFYNEDLCSSCIFKTRNNELKLQTIHENLGKEARKALLGFDSFCRCGQTSKFNGYSKLSCWNLLRSPNKSILEAFRVLGENLSPPTYDGLKNFVMDLYFPKRPFTISNIGELR